MARRVAVQMEARGRGRVTTAELRRIARYILDSEGVAPGVEVEVALADAATVRELNRLYRGRDEETDVLSFEASEGDAFPEAPDAPPSLGEVVICLPVAQSSAERAGMTLEGEVAHLLAHGLLHILGYDHEATEEEALRMQAREDGLLAALGYAGQYEHGH